MSRVYHLCLDFYGIFDTLGREYRIYLFLYPTRQCLFNCDECSYAYAGVEPQAND